MGRLKALLWGLGIGSGAMYFFDPELGERRRAMARDKVTSIRNSSDEAIDKGVRDLRNRARGVMAETMSRVSPDQANDFVLRERIRSKLGTLSTHPRAIEVDVRNGQAIVSGHVLQNEADALVTGLGKLPGIRGVENRLQAHETGENFPMLQGEGRMTDQTGRWSPSTRLLASAGGVLLWLIGSARGGPLGFLMKWGGAALGVRGVSDRSPRALLGMQHDGEMGVVDVRKTVQINAPVEQVYRLWDRFENFPRFMSHVKEIRNMGGGRSHWVVEGPAGTKVEFDAVVTEKVPNELIAWQTVSDAQVKHRGRVRFTNQNGKTRVQVWMTYTPPAGALGHAVATLFGTDPKSAMDEDLMRMKSLVEQGVTTTETETVKKEDVYGKEQGA